MGADLLGRVKGGDNLAAEHKRKALDALKVGVLNGHDAGVGKKL